MTSAREERRWIDVSSRALMTMNGPDAQDLIQRISTNDVSGLSAGKSVQTVFTNEKGKIIEVATVLKGADGILLAGQSNRAELMRTWLEKFIIMEDVTVASVTAAFRHIMMWGSTDEYPVAQNIIRFIEHWNGEQLEHLLIPARATDVLPGLHHAPESKENFEDMRVRKGIPAWPSELNDSVNPLEAGLEALVSWTKGCYVGQEVIARLDTYKKLQKRLFRFICRERPAVLPARLIADGKEAGMITSVSSRPSDSGYPALGYLRTGMTGSDLFLEDGSNVHSVNAIS